MDKFTLISTIEKDLLKKSENTTPKSFRNINKNQWVVNANWPIGAYKILSTIPLGNVLPGHPKLWWNNVRVALGNKISTKRGYKNLIGYFFLYPFGKKKSFNINAEAIFFKRGEKYVVLFYTKKKSVIKLVLTNKQKHLLNLKKEFSQEISGQLIANKIDHPTVSTPKLISYEINNDLIFLEQELVINSRSSKYLSTSKSNAILKEVFDFMFEFYKYNTLELKPLESNHFDYSKIREIFHFYNFDTNLIEKYISLMNQNKKLIYGRIHGDLHYENILFTKGTVYIIDWGESKKSFWVEETLNIFNFFPEEIIKSIFNHLFIHFKFHQQETYNLKDQQLLFLLNKIFKRLDHDEYQNNNCIKRFLLEQFKILRGNNLIS